LAIDRKAAQQIRIDPVAWRRLGGARPAIDRFRAHSPHQRSHVTPAHLALLGGQQALQHARAGEGELQMQLVHAPHQRKIGCRDDAARNRDCHG